MIFPKDTLLHWELYSTISIYAKLNDLGLPLVDSFHLPRSRGGRRGEEGEMPLIPREFGKEKLKGDGHRERLCFGSDV